MSDERVIIVTGAAQGIGRSLAEGLMTDGARVVIADVAGAEQAASELGGETLGLRVDISQPEDCAQMAAATLEQFGRIDGLVNNAGLYSSLVPQPMEEIDIDEWRRVMDVNVLGLHLATRSVVPAMRKAGSGRIVNIASGAPFKGVPFLSLRGLKGRGRGDDEGLGEGARRRWHPRQLCRAGLHAVGGCAGKSDPARSTPRDLGGCARSTSRPVSGGRGRCRGFFLRRRLELYYGPVAGR